LATITVDDAYLRMLQTKLEVAQKSLYEFRMTYNELVKGVQVPAVVEEPAPESYTMLENENDIANQCLIPEEEICWE
jgi:hypothetical protein